MDESASDAARALAEVLLREADNLDSNDLSVVSPSMAEVRSHARAFVGALSSRGWGSDVLYGVEGHEDDDDDDFDGLDDDVDEDDATDDDDADFVAPAGYRITYQSRHDFVVTDEAALATYVTKRLTADAKSPLTFDAAAAAVELDGPFLILTELDGFGGRNYSEAGLVYAGGQDAWRPTSRTLWEMDTDELFEERDDQFPT